MKVSEDEMNEILENLFEEYQKDIWETNIWNGAPEYNGSELDITKFVDLIIEECLKEARNELPDYEPDDDYVRGKYDGIVDVIIRLQNLFKEAK